jgi:hypothetical protein
MFAEKSEAAWYELAGSKREKGESLSPIFNYS